jgi:hypothetical protein
MNRTVGEHIQRLEEQLNILSARIIDEGDTRERNRLESELRAVESALALYRSALEVEKAGKPIPSGVPVIRPEFVGSEIAGAPVIAERVSGGEHKQINQVLYLRRGVVNPS